jgi:hypothetical protein
MHRHSTHHMFLLLIGLSAMACERATPGLTKSAPHTAAQVNAPTLPTKGSHYWLMQVQSMEEARGYIHECDDMPTQIVSNQPGEVWIRIWLDVVEAHEWRRGGRLLEFDSSSPSAGSDGLLLTRQQQASPGCENVEPAPQTFCGYLEDVDRCDQHLYDEMSALAQDYAGFVEVVRLGQTHEDRPIRALRIGHLTGPQDDPSPQIILVAAQHGSREMLTTEIVMRVARHFIQAYDQDTDDVRQLLAQRTLTIVPVLNPDGYDAYFLTGGSRRLNGNPCQNGSSQNGSSFKGVDLNRNHAVDWLQGPNLLSSCGQPSSAGYMPRSEPETEAIEALMGHDVQYQEGGAQITGQYQTAVVANIHSVGNHLVYPTGVDATRDWCGVIHATGQGNCTPTDQDMLQELFGSQAPSVAVLTDERVELGRPYDNGSKGRVFPYGRGGMLSNTALYGALPGTTPRMLSALVEMTRNPCSGTQVSVGTPHDVLARIESDYIDMATRLLQGAPQVLSGKLLGNKLGHAYSLPHIYRIQPGREHPHLRINALRSANQVHIQSAVHPGTTQQDRTLDGVHYRTWTWEKNASGDPYTFSSEYRVCPGNEGTLQEFECAEEVDPTTGFPQGRPPFCVGEKDGCSTAGLDEGSLDLCTETNWSSTTSWSFVGQQSPTPADQCYWELADKEGVLERDPVDLNMVWTRLVFSYTLEWTKSNTQASPESMVVEVSDNGFQNCAHEEGTGCRIIEEYYNEEIDGRNGGESRGVFRTEMFDVHDFDGRQDVQVRFRVEGAKPKYARLYDVHFVGWKP